MQSRPPSATHHLRTHELLTHMKILTCWASPEDQPVTFFPSLCSRRLLGRGVGGRDRQGRQGRAALRHLGPHPGGQRLPGTMVSQGVRHAYLQVMCLYFRSSFAESIEKCTRAAFRHKCEGKKDLEKRDPFMYIALRTRTGMIRTRYQSERVYI